MTCLIDLLMVLLLVKNIRASTQCGVLDLILSQVSVSTTDLIVVQGVTPVCLAPCGIATDRQLHVPFMP